MKWDTVSLGHNIQKLWKPREASEKNYSGDSFPSKSDQFFFPLSCLYDLFLNIFFSCENGGNDFLFLFFYS